MQCSSCGHESDSRARFCPQCGARHDGACSRCQQELPEGARFCPQCGAETGAGSEPAPEDSPDVTGERRQLTVMFCDLVGSTELGQRLDPEELSEVLSRYRNTCAGAVEGFAGFVAQYLGDGILVYFGYPQAHEDDAERAIRAGLAVQTALAGLEPEVEGSPRIEARIGIHTGPVVIGEMASGGGREMSAVGDTTNITARIQGHAAPGSVVVSDATLRLVPGLFQTEDLGTPELKGLSQRLQLHEIVRQTGARTRLEAAHMLSPLLGREQETALLQDRWERIEDGNGQVVLLSGEAGMGKSRLVGAFHDSLAGKPHTWIDAYCSPFTAGTAFLPMLDLLERGLGFGPDESPEARLERLERVQLPGLDPAQTVPYLATLLGLPESQLYPMPQTSAELQRERNLGVLTDMLLATAELQPVVLCIEDLHWCDPSTLEVIARMVEQVPTARALLLLTARPEFWPEWGASRSHVSAVSLARLTSRHARRLVDEALGSHAFDDDVVEQLLERADGVPLFLEELAKAVAESHSATRGEDRRQVDVTVPSTLQDSLAARLDRLSSAKQVAQLAATLGRGFRFELIEAVSEFDAVALRSGLQQLVASEILYERGRPPDSTYLFKHALLQETAYQAQLRSVRRRRHARIAEVTEKSFPDRVESEPERLAHHWAEGGQAEKAAAYFEIAGQRALGQLANPEAVDYFRRGLDLLEKVEESPQRNQLEISLRVGLGGPLASMEGLEAPEVVTNYTRVRELADRVGEGPQQLAAWIGLLHFYSTASAMTEIEKVGYAIMKSAEPLGVTPLQALGHLLVGTALTCTANMSSAVEHLTQVVELGEAGVIPPPTTMFEPDLICLGKATLGTSLLSLGDVDGAFSSQQEALYRAREIEHANSLAVSTILGSVCRYFVGDVEGTRRLVSEGLTTSLECGFRSHAAQLRAYQGWIRVADGDAEGADEVIEACEDYRAAGASSTSAWLECIAAWVLHQAGRDEEAWQQALAAEAKVERNGERNYLPASYRTRARILLAAGNSTEAEHWFARGLEASRSAEIVTDELKLALDLAPILVARGEKGEARTTLAAPYRKFVSGFEIPLLQQARGLLDELGEPS